MPMVYQGAKAPASQAHSKRFALFVRDSTEISPGDHAGHRRR